MTRWLHRNRTWQQAVGAAHNLADTIAMGITMLLHIYVHVTSLMDDQRVIWTHCSAEATHHIPQFRVDASVIDLPCFAKHGTKWQSEASRKEPQLQLHTKRKMLVFQRFNINDFYYNGVEVREGGEVDCESVEWASQSNDHTSSFHLPLTPPIQK